MTGFEELVREWRDAPFPPGSTVDALGEIHDDLALYDIWVAESVLLYVKRGVWEPAAPDVLGALDELTRRAMSFSPASTDDSVAISGYLGYAEILRTVYSAFLREQPAK
jgi:hypothetical protein